MHQGPRLLVAGRSLVAVLAGAAVGRAFPPHNDVWLMPLGIAALLFLVRGRRMRAGLGYGWLFGTAFMLVLLPWLQVIGDDAWIALSVIEGFFYALMGLAWAATSTRRWWPVAAAACWVGAELLRGIVPFGGLPWGRLAFALVDTPFDRYGRLGGTALVSFLGVLVLALAVDVIARRDVSPRGLIQGGVAAALVLVSGVLPVGLDDPGGTVTVAAVQGNVQGVGLHSFSHQLHVLHNHVVATEHLAAQVAAGTRPRPDFVVWPENASDIDPYVVPAARREIEQAVHAIGVPILVGAVINAPNPDNVLNVGIVWSPKTGPGERYVKQHLVPFGEYVPFRGFMTRLIPRLGTEIPRNFAPGDRVGRLDIAGTPIGDLMCFEVAYDNLVRGIVDHGAQLVVVQTNNATYVDTGQLAQQFAMSRYRAIETGRQVVVASTDGISGVFSGTGAVLATGPVHTQVELDRTVRLATGITWGVRLGGGLDLGLSLLGLALTLVAVWESRRRAGRMSR